ncbi:hypothetical protein DMH04_46470 [Kibdelosporangium aridum]|uniref:Uncharacterized protein n=1 Tax=Kibdelosporangium aridum TaxID=2030 RepID=A0A428YM52_KIBAR|nr:hypothetical protein DMH04_46470 [Kibdelosporangium aridum]
MDHGEARRFATAATTAAAPAAAAPAAAAPAAATPAAAAGRHAAAAGTADASADDRLRGLRHTAYGPDEEVAGAEVRHRRRGSRVGRRRDVVVRVPWQRRGPAGGRSTTGGGEQ